jgi:hypothetical protein
MRDGCAVTIKLDDAHDLEVHELVGTDQYWARIVERKTRRWVGDRLLASGTSKDLVFEALMHDALAALEV